ncbi:PREDICTED: uncharacterized protein LOC108777478 [Cyphomyrmex costatus]|uniref:uncharacterized protein LOC108777478 n=1 Tax=Cyphomyrmex costatus TaxID=456900 RepID=UPI0008522399|nr:PREDICTED: uncharacterized protein LOC108777478 [Cyphomyrmex costatus]
MQKNLQKKFLFETVIKLALDSSDEESSDSDLELAEMIHNYYERQPRIPKWGVNAIRLAVTSRFSRARAEGKDYGDAAVGYVEVKREGNLCQVRGKICPEHRVNNKPYSVSMLVNEEIEKVEYVRCEDCAASEGGCKHAVAFLMWVHRRSEEPEPIAIPYATGKNQY